MATAISASVSILIALLGLLGAYWNAVRLEGRRAEMAFVNEQLRSLYGPLYSLSQASTATWRAFRDRHRRGPRAFFDPARPPTPDELAEWVLWHRTVFFPANRQMIETILAHADLVLDDAMPPSFLDLIAHVEGYRVVLKKWEQGDFSSYVSMMNYPEAFADDVRDGFERLRRRQQALMAQRFGRNDRGARGR